MDREELLANLHVLAARAKTSPDAEVKHASIVLYSLAAAVLSHTTPLLSEMAGEYSRQMIAANTGDEG